MEVTGLTIGAAHSFVFPSRSSIAWTSNVKPLKCQLGFKNISHMRLITSHKSNNYTVQHMPWGKGFYSRKEHASTAAPYWPSKHACLLVVCSVSHSQRNDVGEVRSVEKNLEKGIVLPVSSEVESLITTICDTTSIAEFKLNLAGFNLYIKRNLIQENVNAPIHAASPPTSISAQAPVSNGSASTTSVAIFKSKPSLGGIQRILDTATDDGLVILQSPKVGYFRRSRTIKGKRAPPSCKEKQKVKEGQILCYIEQLGGEIPLESDVSGEVIKILRTDGEPVGFGDALIAILPSFPGIKKLSSHSVPHT